MAANFSHMAARTPHLPPVPAGDAVVLDRQLRVWRPTNTHTNPFRSMWQSADRGGAGANWAHLNLAYGVMAVFDSLEGAA
jgi:hypothetical protein